MIRNNGPVHVASIRSARQGKVYQPNLLCRTYRENGKVKHHTLGNISHLPPHIIELIRGSLQGRVYMPSTEAFQVIRSLPHRHVAAVLGTLRKLDMERPLATRPSRQRDMVVAMVISRIIHPCSKPATCHALADEMKFTSMGETLNLGDSHLD